MFVMNGLLFNVQKSIINAWLKKKVCSRNEVVSSMCTINLTISALLAIFLIINTLNF